jgi:hypothetical protein
VPRWLRILVMMAVLAGWLAVVVVSLFQGDLPDYKLLGIPGALVLVIWPPKRKPRRDDDE